MLNESVEFGFISFKSELLGVSSITINLFPYRGPFYGHFTGKVKKLRTRKPMRWKAGKDKPKRKQKETGTGGTREQEKCLKKFRMELRLFVSSLSSRNS